MTYRVRIKKTGQFWEAYVDGVQYLAKGATKQEALDNLKEEILFQLQSCPCDRVPSSAVELEVIDDYKNSA